MWFKKQQKPPVSGLPQLPELPELPEIPEQPYPIEDIDKTLAPISLGNETLPSLPSFPNSETANKISREAIKSALDIKTKPYTQEIGSSGQKEVGEEEGEAFKSVMPLPTKFERNEPIFVRIDKFQAAIKNINDIRRQISEIESYLAEIRKIKAKEEQELQEWQQEILEIKSKLDSVDKTLFSKLG